GGCDARNVLDRPFNGQRHGSALPWIMCQPKEAALLRIFLVDDNAMARDLIREALQQHSEWVVVGEAGDGRQALEKFSDHRPQLTVMDFLMPEMNGLEAARQLTERNPDALILRITTDPSSQLEEEAKRAGIKGLCAKDEMQSLASAIDTVIHGGTYFREDVAA
ncbi:MAG TPA: response regulator transcription factor, partial [Candidatus Sulfotelmatobacter sp.]